MHLHRKVTLKNSIAATTLKPQKWFLPKKKKKPQKWSSYHFHNYIANLLPKFQTLGYDLRPDFTDTKSAFNSEIPIIIRIKHYFITSKIKLRSFEQRMNFHQSNKIYNGTKFLSG